MTMTSPAFGCLETNSCGQFCLKVMEQLKHGGGGEVIYAEMRVINISLFWMVQRGRPPAPALWWPTPSAPLGRRSRWGTASTSPAWTVSSWMELSRSPVVQTASGNLCPPAACPHTFQPKYPIKIVSLFFCRLVFFLPHLFWFSETFVWSPARCGAPPAGKNSNVADGYVAVKSFASGDRVQYVCDVGYAQAGGSRYRKCVDGKWTSLRLRCERMDLFFFFSMIFQTTSSF